MLENNIFSFATKELSQDAFLCWMSNWYNFDSKLSGLAKNFISLIFSRSHLGNIKIESIDVLRQYNKIDVLLLINKQIAIIIEDKTDTTEHDAQIRKYEKNIKENGVKVGEDKYAVEDVVCTYFKTAEYVFEDERIVEDNSIVKVTRKDMLELVVPYVEHSEIIKDYYLYLKSLDEAYDLLNNEYRNYNYDKTMMHSYLQYKFFFDCFAEGEFEKKLPKHESIPELEPVIQQGTTAGKPYTWYWIYEFSKNIPEEKRRKYGRYLGFRIDTENGRAYVAFKMYCRYDKNNPDESELQNNQFIMVVDTIKKLVKNIDKHIEIKFKKHNKVTTYECEVFKCYLKDNVFDDDSLKTFRRFLRSIANTFDLFGAIML